MTDTPTPPAMTPEQRAELVLSIRYRSPSNNDPRAALQHAAAAQLEADGVTIATLTAERDAAQAEIARLTSERPYIVGWNHGFDEANYQHEHGCPSDGGIEPKFVYTEADMAAALKKVTAT